MNTFVMAYQFVKSHLTKALGFVQGTIAAVAAVDGIIPPAHLKYYMGVLGVLTFWRGYWTGKQAP